MSIDGASKPHLFATFVVALVAINMIMFGPFDTRLAGFLLLILDAILFGKFYEKL
ncbi:MAG: hypothetical protein HY516_01225 [Candidatus Aenigmarchaeota archaeon]|nr:hypothetical protein [Candidatus Aenigmarchaeota archaeon]